MTDKQLQEYTQNAARKLLLEKFPGVETGDDVFKSINGDPSLTPQEKQRVCCGLARAITLHECMKAMNGQPETLMREDTKGTQFMTAYLNHHAKDYFEAVRDKGTEAGIHNRVTDRDDLGDPGYVGASRDLMKAYTTELPHLSKEATQFLVTSMDAIRQAMPEHVETVIPMVMSSSMVLRGPSSLMSRDYASAKVKQIQSGKKKEFDDDFLEAEVSFQANKAVLELANRMGSTGDGEIAHGSAQVLSGEDEVLDEFVGTMARMTHGMTPNHEDIVNVPRVKIGPVLEEDKLNKLEERRVSDKQRLENTAGDLTEKLDKLETTLNRLSTKPNTGDKIKASLTKGGIEKMKQDLIEKIDSLKMKILMKTSPETFQELLDRDMDNIRNLQRQRRELKQGYDEYKLARENLKNAKKTLKLINEELSDGTRQASEEKGIIKGLQQDKKNARAEMKEKKSVYEAYKNTNREVKDKEDKKVKVQKPRQGIHL